MTEETMNWKLGLGANFFPDKKSVCFRVWAPLLDSVAVRIFREDGTEASIPMVRENQEYWTVNLDCRDYAIEDGTEYAYLLDDEKLRPDPLARWQADTVHGHSRLVDPDAFVWEDVEWSGIPQDRLVLYELHTGTFSESGTFAGIVDKLDYLKELGINCIELLPVAQFPGERNWGYDGVGLYAVQNTYGGPQGLKELVNACHKKGIAVCMDVVYNHLGPEGNYLFDFGPYFTDHYRTPWGMALNYDQAYSNGVREYIINNALYWLHEYHIDVLRLDAVHSIYDFSALHILQELNSAVHREAGQLGRTVSVIAESDLNDVRLINPVERGGYALDGQWSDDFHHAMHVILSGERNGYYEDFHGIADLAKALGQAFVYDGVYSGHRKRRHGNAPIAIPGKKFVIATQNHDQVGNRAWGDRLASSISPEAQKTAACFQLLSPYTPLIFMGQEYGETAPFQYFIDHGDADLRKAVQEGRRSEFASFNWDAVADPADPETFLRSRLQWNLPEQDPHTYILNLYRDLLALRRELEGFTELETGSFQVEYSEEAQWLRIRFILGGKSYGLWGHFSDTEKRVACPLLETGKWRCLIHSQDSGYGGQLGDASGLLVDNKVRLLPVSAFLYMLTPDSPPGV